MTSYSPRIYLYKITFEEVPYYYYGVKKEKYFNQEYWGSSVTHKWVWNFYTPKKQILELFDFTDEGWIEAQEVEKRLIKSFYNTDKWCLNENCGGIVSLGVLRETGKMQYENKIGIHGRTKEKMSEDGKKSGKIGGSIAGKIIGKRNKENGIGIFGRSKEKMSEDSRKGGSISSKRNKENRVGIFSMTTDELSEAGKRGGSQRWECCVTGYVSNAAGVNRYQKKRVIDTSKRVRIS